MLRRAAWFYKRASRPRHRGRQGAGRPQTDVPQVMPMMPKCPLQPTAPCPDSTYGSAWGVNELVVTTRSIQPTPFKKPTPEYLRRVR